MERLLSKLLGILKYLLFFVAFVLVFYGILITYKRLEKSLVESISVFLPFVLIFITFIANLFMKNNSVKEHLLFNFTCVLAFSVVIVICLRAMFDDFMVMYIKYDIKYNPLFLSDNLSAIEMLLYVLAGSNVVLMVSIKLNDSLNKNTNLEVKQESVKEIAGEVKEVSVSEKLVKNDDFSSIKKEEESRVKENVKKEDFADKKRNVKKNKVEEKTEDPVEVEKEENKDEYIPKEVDIVDDEEEQIL